MNVHVIKGVECVTVPYDGGGPISMAIVHLNEDLGFGRGVCTACPLSIEQGGSTIDCCCPNSRRIMERRNQARELFFPLKFYPLLQMRLAAIEKGGPT